MKASDVHFLVEEIRAMSGDPEAAHAAEDQLYVDVLRAIASGKRGARELAAAALESQEINFPRWTS